MTRAAHAPMRYALAGITIAAQQETFIHDWGAEVWEWVCNAFEGRFTVSDVAGCPAIAHYAPRTRIDLARCILRNVTEEYRDRPDDCPIERRGNSYRIR